MCTLLFVILLLVFSVGGWCETTLEKRDVGKTIEWDKSTLTLVNQGGTYARMIRLQSGEILCSFENMGKSWVRLSLDNGRTWDEPVLAAKARHGAAANPELLELASGWILLFYNQRPNDGVHRYAIHVNISKDNGKTWRRHSQPYQAGADFTRGCWEPAGIQLPNGEIQLFFANEYPYSESKEQEITLMRSFDNGRTWSKPKAVSLRRGHRDGMPVPLILQNDQGIVIAIEDNGYSIEFLPAIIHTTMEDNWRQPTATGSSPRRWRALNKPLSQSWGAAPYIRQMPTGETVLSCHTRLGGREQPHMVVYVGDENAQNFGGKSVPFDLPSDRGGWWNSLFVKDDNSITAISACSGGIWSIDGKIVEKK